MDTSAMMSAKDRIMAGFQKNWVCKRCCRFCVNCAGRSCMYCCVKELKPHHLFTEKEMKDTVRYNEMNRSSLFEDPMKPVSSSNMVNHEWTSEGVDFLVANPPPLMRHPWPWEQPRYEPNMRQTITYVSPAEFRQEEVEEKMALDGRQHNYGVEVPPLSYHLRQYYKCTHPNYYVRY